MKHRTKVVLVAVALAVVLSLFHLFKQELFSEAVRANHPTTMKLLVWLGADANRSIEPTVHPILCATYADNAEALEFLLNHGADVNAKTCCNVTALIIAVERENLQIMRLLLARGVEVNAVGDDGSALHIALKKNNLKVVELLTQYGAKECKSYEYCG